MVAARPRRGALGLWTAAGPWRGVHGRPPRSDVAGPPGRTGAGVGGHRLPGLGSGLCRVAVRRWSSCQAACISRRFPLTARSGAVDIGTADKVAVAALALWFDSIEWGGFDRSTFAVVEIGSAFSAILVVEQGRLVDASAGTRGPIGTAIRRMLGRRTRLLARSALEGRPLPRRTGRPGRDRPGRPFANR